MPIRNEGAFIDESLGAVLSQHDVAPPEVIVVDGHSDDGTPDRVRQVAAAHGAEVTVLDNPRRIVPVSMNLALAATTADVVVRVDGHCVIAPDYLRRCLDSLAATGVECVGGPMETIGETPTARAIAAAQSSRVGVGGVAFRTSTEAAFVDTLAFGAYRREVFDRIGVLRRGAGAQPGRRAQPAPHPGRRSHLDGPVGPLDVLQPGHRQGPVAAVPRLRLLQGRGHAQAPHRALTPAPGPRCLRRRRVGCAGLVAGRTDAVARGGRARALRRRSSRRRRSPPPARPGAPAPTVALATTTMHTAYGLGWWAGAARELGRALRR